MKPTTTLLAAILMALAAHTALVAHWANQQHQDAQKIQSELHGPATDQEKADNLLRESCNATGEC